MVIADALEEFAGGYVWVNAMELKYVEGIELKEVVGGVNVVEHETNSGGVIVHF